VNVDEEKDHPEDLIQYITYEILHNEEAVIFMVKESKSSIMLLIVKDHLNSKENDRRLSFILANQE